MNATEIVVRPAGAGDRSALEEFECSNGTWYEDEVQNYVRERAYSDAVSDGDFALLVAEEADRIVACVGYLPELMAYDDAAGLMAVRLHVVAIALPDQGRILSSGKRLSTALMEAVIAIIARMGAEVITGIVARDNLKSLALCERIGLRNQVGAGSRYVRVWARFADRPFEFS